MKNGDLLRSELEKEFEDYYSQYPIPADDAELWLNEEAAANPGESSFRKKSLIYKVIAGKCNVHLFRSCPFYFEVQTGRARNGLTAAFPPEPGLGGWLMRHNNEYAEDFFSCRKALRDEKLLYWHFPTDFSHHCVGYDNVLQFGFDGIRKKAEMQLLTEKTDSETDFLRSVIVGCDAIGRLGTRFSERAMEMAKSESDENVKRDLMRIARTAAKVPFQPPETFYEALNTIWFIREIVVATEGIGVAILGHIDRMLQPYFEHDIEKGIMDRQEAQRLLLLWLSMTDFKWNIHDDLPLGGVNTAIIIGGCDEHGNIIYNDVTRMILDAFDEYPLVNPKLQARISPRHPDEYFKKLAKIASKGRNVLSIFNDYVLIASETRQGKPIEDARLYVAGGCQEPLLQNTEINCRAYAYFSLPKLLECYLYPEETCLFEKIGIEPPDVESIVDFETFYEGLMECARRTFENIVEDLTVFERGWASYSPCPLYSSTITGCIENAKDMTQGGAKHNYSSVPMVGSATLCDALCAIREVVFDNKIVSMNYLKAVLKNDFKDNIRLKDYLCNRSPKVGSGNEETDAFYGRMLDDLADAFSGLPNARGGFYEPSLFSNSGYIEMCGIRASADGRNESAVFSRGVGPSDLSGANDVSRIMQCVRKLNLDRYPGSAVLYLDMPFTPGKTDDAVFSHIIRYFLDVGGNVLDFNVVDSDTIQKANLKPNDYPNLVVRVWGFSAYFASLDEDLRNEIAHRTLKR